MSIYVDKFCYTKMRAANYTVPIILSTLTELDADKLLQSNVYFNLPTINTLFSKINNSDNKCSTIILPVIVKYYSGDDVYYKATFMPKKDQVFISYTKPNASDLTILISNFNQKGLLIRSVAFNNPEHKAQVLIIGYNSDQIQLVYDNFKKLEDPHGF